MPEPVKIDGVTYQPPRAMPSNVTWSPVLVYSYGPRAARKKLVLKPGDLSRVKDEPGRRYKFRGYWIQTLSDGTKVHLVEALELIRVTAQRGIDIWRQLCIAKPRRATPTPLGLTEPNRYRVYSLRPLETRSKTRAGNHSASKRNA